ncbi:MAG: DUF1801 domain-containing protein [Spirochaetota bacterium]
MTGETGEFSTIDEYIAGCDPALRQRLTELRKVIHEEAPGAAEKISYRMPGFELKGALCWFAACAGHIGFYPTGEGVGFFKDELSAYRHSKGAVQFPLDKAIPYELVRKIVRHRVERNAREAAEKAARKKAGAG